jgi:type IX secretion system PorP/SprF family membrane protein
MPVLLGNFRENYSFFNPAVANTESKFDFFVTNQRNTGAWSGIQQYLAATSMRIGKNKDKFHSLGATLQGEQEGELLRRTRIYANYAFHLKLSKKLWASTGMALGAMNYLVVGTNSSAGGADFAPDGTVGLLVYNENIKIGISVGQMFNNSVQPIVEVYKLGRLYQAFAERKFEIKQNFDIITSIMVRRQSFYNHDLIGGITFLGIDLLSASMFYRYEKSLIFSTGFENIPTGFGNFKILFCYHVPLANYGLANVNTYEISLRYLLKDNPKAVVNPLNNDAYEW